MCCTGLSCLLCLTLCNPVDCSTQGSSVHEIPQARILEWVAIYFSNGSSWSKDWTRVSYIGRQILYHWATWHIQKEKLFSQDLIFGIAWTSGWLPKPFQRLCFPYLHIWETSKIQFVCLFLLTDLAYPGPPPSPSRQHYRCLIRLSLFKSLGSISHHRAVTSFVVVVV